jgi:hypothetical protein
VQLQLELHTSPHLPISPHISPSLPTSPHISQVWSCSSSGMRRRRARPRRC